MMLMVDSERPEMTTESLSPNGIRRRMTFQIEEMSDVMIEGMELRRRDFVLELNRKTGRVFESEDGHEPTMYDCEAP
jgi:hypothetical protein